MTTGLLAGTFDPPTLGHVDLIRRATHLCDRLFVSIARNSSKSPLFTVDERLTMLKLVTRDLVQVEPIIIEGLVADFASLHNIDFLIRGLRGSTDLAHECDMANANRYITGIETVFITADEAHSHLSSTLIREIARSGSHLEHFVPEAIAGLVYEKVKTNHPKTGL